MKSADKHSIKIWAPLALAIVFIGGMWTGRALFSSQSPHLRATEKLEQMLGVIDAEYVDKVNLDSLLEVSLPDILAHLDPHTIYIPKKDLQAVNDELGGSFSGIGISFSLLNDTITVLEIISGGPSEKVGLMAGDRIITINDSTATGKSWNNEKVMTSLRGPKGSKVKLGIKRSSSSAPLTFTVTRGDIPVTSIDASYMIAPQTGYIRVNKFGQNTFSEFFQSMSDLVDAEAKKVIIDLRGNGGGFMEPAILMANEFLERGQTIVSTRGRIPGNDITSYADGSGTFKEMDVAVLLDEFSASASEIFAGAIQDNDRGIIIGRRSFGKGLVQNQIELSDSSALRLTVARYYTPSGRCIQKPYSGDSQAYSNDLLNRFNHGEAYSADSIKLDKTLVFETISGRKVYGGGGIMPDIFVPNDTSGITSWYLQASNAGLLNRFAFEFTDLNRQALRSTKTVRELLSKLPSDDALLESFVEFAGRNKVPARWYYINISRDLIVNQLKALIARDVIGQSAFYEIFNTDDKTILRAISQLKNNKVKQADNP